MLQGDKARLLIFTGMASRDTIQYISTNNDFSTAVGSRHGFKGTMAKTSQNLLRQKATIIE